MPHGTESGCLELRDSAREQEFVLKTAASESDGFFCDAFQRFLTVIELCETCCRNFADDCFHIGDVCWRTSLMIQTIIVNSQSITSERTAHRRSRERIRVCRVCAGGKFQFHCCLSFEAGFCGA